MKIDKDIKLSGAHQHDGATQWWMAIGNGYAHGPGDYPSMSISPGNDADLTFTILNPKDASFDQSHPIDIQQGTAKPGAGVDAQFHVTAQSAQSLTVHDDNSAKGEASYNYVIHFSNGSQLDPIIKNGGCCPGIDYLTLGAALVGAAVALYLLFRLLTVKNLSSREDVAPR